MEFSRRDLLAAPLAMALPSPGAEGGGPWHNRPNRWGQLTLVEDDPPKLDPGYWVKYFQSCQCDTVTLSAGGIVAYYPTKIPLHYRSKFLGGRDSFGDLVRGCQKLGMTTVARIDPHAANEDVFRAHPEWISRDPDGKVRRHPVMPELYLTCTYGPYRRTFMVEVIREIVSLYRVDGIFANRWVETGSFAVCYCDWCRASFRQAHGRDLPLKRNPRDPVWRDFTLWYQETVFSLMKLWDDEIRKVKPDSRYVPNNGGSALNALDWKRFGEMAPLLIADHQGRSGTTPPWNNGQLAKVYRSVAGGKPVVGSSGINLAVPARWMKSVKPAAEQQIWMADGVAGGFVPKFSKFGGVMEDERWMPQVERFYRWHKSAEALLRDRRPLARVGLVYSQQTAHYYGAPESREHVAAALNGMYQALVEARLPFEMVHDGKLDAESTRGFQVLLLPNIAALSDAQCEQLRAFARGGGSLVATFETSLYDERGEPRKEFGLADTLGIRYRGKVLGPLHNSYLAFHGEAGRRHPILAGFDAAAYTVNCVHSVDTASAAEDYRSPITLIPGYPDLPMEFVYERVPRPDTPQVFLGENGRSRTVYFPMDLDRTFWEILLEDHGRLLANAVRWALNEPPQVTVTGPGLLDVTVWTQPNRLIIHLVNLNNPMTMRGQFREFLPVGPQKVRLDARLGTRVAGSYLQVSGRKLAASESAGGVELTVPSVADHELLVVEYA